MISSGASASGSGRPVIQNQIVSAAKPAASTSKLIATKLSEMPKVTATDTKKNITSAYIRLGAKLVGDDQQFLEPYIHGAVLCGGLWSASMDQPLRTAVGLARWHSI